MNKLIIDYPQLAREEIDFRKNSHARIDKYQPIVPHMPVELNPGAWGLAPYESYLRIYIDMAMPFHPNVVTVERETCEIETHNEGTLSEYYDVRILRRTTIHALTGDELGAAWPEIERRKQEGMKLEISEPLSILQNPYSAVSYIGI
jgi:hypothetical protein